MKGRTEEESKIRDQIQLALSVGNRVEIQTDHTGY